MMNAGQDYGVRVITAYEQRRVGQVFFPPGALRQALIKRGLVELVIGESLPLSEPEDSEPRRGRLRKV